MDTEKHMLYWNESNGILSVSFLFRLMNIIGVDPVY